MRSLILVAASSLALAACDSAPSEESPVAPTVVCEQAAENGACPEYDAVVTNEMLMDGNVITDGEVVDPTTDDAFVRQPTNAM